MAYDPSKAHMGRGSLGKMNRRRVKDRYKHMAAGGELVSDRETKQFEDRARAAAMQGIQAQQTAANRQAMAGGPTLAGAQAAASKAAMDKAADAAVKASSEASTYRADLREKRRAQIQAEGERQIARNRAAAATAAEYTFYALEAGNVLASAFQD